jgi:hypothetical protein
MIMEEEEKPAEDASDVKPEEAHQEPPIEGLNDTDSLPSETKEADENDPEPSKIEKAFKKDKKILDKMGNPHDPGPPGSSHG